MKRELTPDVEVLDDPFAPVAQPVTIAPGVVIGGRDVVLMAGPCSVESYEQTRAVAEVAPGATVDVVPPAVPCRPSRARPPVPGVGVVGAFAAERGLPLEDVLAACVAARDDEREQTEKFGSREADEEATLLAVSSRRIAQRALKERTEDVTNAASCEACTNCCETGTDQFCCFCFHDINSC